MPLNCRLLPSWVCTDCVGKLNCFSSDLNRYSISIHFLPVKGLQPRVGCWHDSLLPVWPSASCSLPDHFPPGATNCDSDHDQNPRTHSPWSRFRMTLWAMRGAVLWQRPLVVNPQMTTIWTDCATHHASVGLSLTI